MIRLLLLTALSGAALVGIQPPPGEGQPEPNSIRYFRAFGVSPTEVRIQVIYHYDGSQGTDHVSVSTSAIQSDGTPVPGLVSDVTNASVVVGAGKAITVLRMESPPEGPVTSTQMRVCLSHRVAGPFLCETFPYRRLWNATALPPPPPPTPPIPVPPPSDEPKPTPPQPPAPVGTCAVTGQISGPLVWRVNDHREGRNVTRTYTLREMTMTAPGGVRLTAAVSGGSYVFANVPAGHTYWIEPGRFRSEPSSRRIDCRRNIVIRNANFTITGGPNG